MSNLGPLPPADYWSTRDDDTPLFTAEQMRAYAAEAVAAERTARQEAQHRVADLQERINKADRDLALAVAKERERWRAAVAPVLKASEGELPHAIDVLAAEIRKG